MLSLARGRLIVHFPYLYVKKIAAKVQHFFDMHKTVVAKNVFFIRFREQGRVAAHDFVVAHVKKKQ